MSVNTLYKFLKIAGAVQTNQITDEVYTDVGSDDFQLGTVKRAFLGGADLVIRTAAAGGGDLLVEDVDYEVLEEDFDYTEECGFHVYTGISFLTGAYQSGDLYFTYKTIGSYTDPDVFNDVLEKVLGGLTIGDLKQRLDYLAPASSHPWLPLNKGQTVSTTNWASDFIDYLRAIKSGVGAAGSEVYDFSATAWAISSNVATITLKTNSNLAGTVTAAATSTLTFSSSQTLNVGDVLILSNGSYGVVQSGSGTSWVIDIAITITAGTARVATMEDLLVLGLAEEQLSHGSYTGWFCVTLTEAIGDITAGTYAITNVNASNNTLSFAFTAGDNSGSGTYTDCIQIHPHRVPGSTTQARTYSLAGLTMHGAGDRNLYWIGGYRRRMRMQGHRHTTTRPSYWGAGDVQNNGWCADNGVRQDRSNPTDATIITDTIAGPPLTGKHTHGAGFGGYWYIYGGTYAA